MKTSADFSRLITDRSIAISWNGKNKTILADSELYSKVLVCIKEERWDELEKLLDTDAAVKKFSNSKMRVENGQVTILSEDGEFIAPARLNSVILWYIENNLPSESLVNFAIKLNTNPSFRSVQQLFNFLETNRFTITENGNFIAYKKVKVDFKDYHTGTFDNSVGQVLKMPRNQVNENADDHCSNGLHAANWEYSHSIFHSSEGVMVIVEVNPRDVVSIPNDYNCAKMRVCEYKVIGVTTEEYVAPIYKSTACTDISSCYKCNDECECDCDSICHDCGYCQDKDCNQCDDECECE